MTPPSTIERSSPDRSDIAIAASLARYARSLFSLGPSRVVRAGLLVIAGALAEGFGILLLVPLLDIVFRASAPHGSWRVQIGSRLLHGVPPAMQLIAILLLFVVLVAARGVIVWRRDVGIRALSLDLVEQWRARVMAALCRAEWLQLRALKRGRIEFSVTADIARLSLGSDRLLRGTVAFIQFAVLTAVAIALSPLFALCLVALLILALPLGWRLARRAYGHGTELTRRGSIRHETFIEFMAGMKLAKALGAERQYADEFLTISADLRDQSIAYLGRQARALALYQVAAACVAAALLWIGLTIGDLSPQAISALLVVFARLSSPLRQIVQGSQSLLIVLPALDELCAIERSLSNPAGTGQTSAPRPAGKGPAAMALRDIRFRYPGQSDDALRDIDLDLAAGEFAALVGPSGSGKTTLADILIGLMPPGSGSVAIDGAPLRNDPSALATWRRQIGYVPQDPFLFDRSIAENLRWTHPDASDATLWDVLNAVEAADLVDALPQGLASRVGDRGTRLSGGERQRICLARALLRRPRLLVLDEATSALDPPTEERLLQTLAGLSKRPTILMIAHRLPQTAPVDRYLKIADGRL